MNDYDYGVEPEVLEAAITELSIELAKRDGERTTVYRFLDEEGRLLYVGITNRLHSRLKTHSRVQDWWGKVATATFEHYESRTEALFHEAKAIQDEGPLHNVQVPVMPLHLDPEAADERRHRMDAEREIRGELALVEARVAEEFPGATISSLSPEYQDVVRRLEEREAKRAP